MKKRILLLAAALCLLLSGCGGGLLEREWSSVTPHSAGYWENGDKDTLRADSYQDAVNAILMLVANHAERGVVRCYFGSDAEYAELAAEACNEVQQETDLGAYLLDYITYAGTDERGFYELTLSFGYRRTAEEQEGIINATSTEAIPDLLRAAAAEGADRLVVRVSYFSTDRAGVEQMVRDVQEEKDGGRDAGILAAPWQVSFYPDTDEPGIVEITLKYKEKGKKLMWSMIWPILIVVGANTFYHICAKSTPENANAFASLAITYGVGAVLSIVMFYLTGARGLAGELGKTNWTAWVLGIAVVGLEFGNICLYRAGWKVSVGSLIANITLACVLLAVGLLVYHETVSLRQGLGVLVCLAGIYLVGA